MARRQTTTRSPRFNRQLNIVPDRLDLRDRLYMPSLGVPPDRQMKPKLKLPVLDQQRTNACTGFALASVVNFLLRRHRDPRTPPISPYMLYSMARRYDEFPGATADVGSSLRGAMRGWYKHGACRSDLWSTVAMPPPSGKTSDDWWLDAAQRPLGAYYRVDTRSVSDMHVALHEVGILYASVVCHAGWLAPGRGTRDGGYRVIPPRTTDADAGGHAFVIVGYTTDGFIIQNSWGVGWGTGGLAILTYQDWTNNAMDCWVAQLGVVTDEHREIARSPSLRTEDGTVKMAADHTLRDREISPFVVDMENNGRLSSSGTFRTQRGDVNALVTDHVKAARAKWGLRPTAPLDVAVYAHGGLTGEETAAATAARWIPALYEERIFPIFLMWETDLWSTLHNRLADLVSGLPKATGGLVDQLQRFWNRRLEKLLAPPGSAIWGEMKQNADYISAYDAKRPVEERTGGQLLYESAKQAGWFDAVPVRLHLIGHSAGAIVHCFIVHRLASLGWKFESVNFMAPAVTVELFQQTLAPRVKDGTVKQLRSFHLADAAEEQDPTCRPVLGYGRSLLYLVSESFEGQIHTPILGMEKYFKAATDGLPRVKAWIAPGPASNSTTHGGFDDDVRTMKCIIDLIKSS